MDMNSIPGWEGSIGPFPKQYGQPHVYARDVHSGAGNCVCGDGLNIDFMFPCHLHQQAAGRRDATDHRGWVPAAQFRSADQGGKNMIDVIQVRLLGTGSRLLTDRTLIHRALTDEVDELQDRDVCLQRDEILIVHGGQGYIDRRTGITKGADLLIDQEARAMGLSVKPVPARWLDPCRPECSHGPRKVNRFGQSYCQRAGFYRNQEMVDLWAYERCIAFPLGRSVGTRDCMRRARAAGIEVVPYEAVMTQ